MYVSKLEINKNLYDTIFFNQMRMSEQEGLFDKFILHLDLGFKLGLYV